MTSRVSLSEYDGAADAFIDSLFGTAKTRRSSKKHHHRAVVARRSVFVLPSAHDNMTSEEIQLYESSKMSHAESEQKNVDRFWGLDKEASDCHQERILMAIESENSLSQEMQFRTALKRRVWERDEQVKNYESAYLSSIREGQARRSYMRTFYQAESSADVIFFNWPTRQHIRPSSKKSQKTRDSDTLVQDDIERMVEAYLRSSESGFDIVDFTESQTNVHLGGRQQSCVVLSADDDPAVMGNFIGDVSRGGSSTNVAAKATRPLDFKRKVARARAETAGGGGGSGSGLLRSMTMSSLSPQRPRGHSAESPSRRSSYSPSRSVVEEMAVGGGGGGGGGASSRPGTSQSTARGFKNMPVQLLTRPKHLDALDGHPTHKWDQIMMLRQVYGRLASSTTDGRVSGLQLASIRNDSTVLRLLRFTVLGVWVKRKQWSKFQSLLGSHTSISLLELVQGARAMSSESAVSAQNLRTDEEHQGMALAAWRRDVMQTAAEDAVAAFAGQYAQQERGRRDRADRDAYLSRKLAQGDCVWGMIGGARVWLPAVVESVNDDGTYDLSYPLTLAALQQAKVMATSRELLALPSNTTSGSLNPKPFKTEKEVCSYVFDVVASGTSTKSADIVDAQKLWDALQSARFCNVVRTSVALSLVMFGAVAYNYPRRDEFLAMFFREFTEDGKVKKTDFVDYCVGFHDIVAETGQL